MPIYTYANQDILVQGALSRMFPCRDPSVNAVDWAAEYQTFLFTFSTDQRQKLKNLRWDLHVIDFSAALPSLIALGSSLLINQCSLPRIRHSHRGSCHPEASGRLYPLNCACNVERFRASNVRKRGYSVVLAGVHWCSSPKCCGWRFSAIQL